MHALAPFQAPAAMCQSLPPPLSISILPSLALPPSTLPNEIPFLSKSSGKSLGKTANSLRPKPISCRISARRGLLEARINVALLLKLAK